MEHWFGTCNRGIWGQKKKKNLTCGWSFKLEPKSQLEGLGWITAGFVLMYCGHQIASLLLYCLWLLREQQVRMDGSKQTRRYWGIFQYVIGLEVEVQTTNPTRATQLEHTIISYQWIDRHWEKAFNGTRSGVMVGMLSCHEHTLEHCSFSLSQNGAQPVLLQLFIQDWVYKWHKYRLRHRKKNNVAGAFLFLDEPCLLVPSDTLRLVRYLTDSLSSHNSQVQIDCCYSMC